ncbi:DUF327 family protein [Thermanaerosceptrum fracticalcis]|uniref:DUF327 family protein n=1 Tax=Thermanaerosceptrum fracticalcis TaxID=1712410 RepID=A0A7G6E5B2_THEFR|nr:YaaR family protein [Thermanaerosceptrum fracticalcis]QNB47266.1 DUF327 family protein [Thermanaerosceptrum fracticalcis]
MRIRNEQKPKNLIASPHIAGRRETRGLHSPEFPDLLNHYSGPDWQLALDEILKKLDEAGQRLAKNFSVYDMKLYKETLKKFLYNTLGRVYDLKEETGWTRQGRPKVYQRIEMINGELEELSRLVLAEQKDSLKILEKMDHIRGLLVDLYS